MTDECLGSSKGRSAALTRTVTGAILAPYKTQRLVVSDRTGTYLFGITGEEHVRVY